MFPCMTEAKSPVLSFLWYAPAQAGTPDRLPDWWSRASHIVLEPICIFVKKQQYMFLSMLCTPNMWMFLWLLSDVLNRKQIAL